jgi:hypothetical protein
MTCSKTKQLYILEWYGPYNSSEEMESKAGINDCSVYLITGQNKYSRNNSKCQVIYVGMTKRVVPKRIIEKDHIEKQANYKNKQFWAAKFSNISNNNPEAHARLVESCLIRFLSLAGAPLINKQGTRKNPKSDVAVVSRWNKKFSEEGRYNKSSKLWWLSDVILYQNEKFWFSEKIYKLYVES